MSGTAALVVPVPVKVADVELAVTVELADRSDELDTVAHERRKVAADTEDDFVSTHVFKRQTVGATVWKLGGNRSPSLDPLAAVVSVADWVLAFVLGVHRVVGVCPNEVLDTRNLFGAEEVFHFGDCEADHIT